MKYIKPDLEVQEFELIEDVTAEYESTAGGNTGEDIGWEWGSDEQESLDKIYLDGYMASQHDKLNIE